MTLRDLFEVAADAHEEGRPDVRDEVLRQAGPAAAWYWVIGPERGRPPPPTSIPRRTGWIAFHMLAFPMVRQVYPTLIANELVSVQPMTAPSGSIFFMDYRYEARDGL